MSHTTIKSSSVHHPYLEFTIFCPDDLKELVESELLSEGFEGVWENDDKLCFYVKESDLDMEVLKSILGQYHLLESYSFKSIENINWNEQWESSFEPINIGDKCIIRAEFHEPSNLPLEIIITPKMSFGTGHHETTYMVAEAILALELRGLTVLDMGCGSAVLSILAEKLGAKSVMAIDYDEWAIDNAHENISNNGCSRISLQKGDGIFEGQYDLIVSNINRNLNLQLLEKYALALNKNGKIILSGFYNHDVEAFEKVLNTLGLKIALIKEKKDWACIILEPC